LPNDTKIYFLSVTNGVLTSGHQAEIIVHHLPVIVCGNDITICTEDCAQLCAEAINFSEVFWETTGDGCFCNPSTLQPSYTPGPNDIQNGSVTVSNTANPLSACDVAAYDEMNVVIFELPSMTISEELSFCESQTILLESGAENFSQINWSTNGDGTFEEPTASSTIYYPGQVDLANHEIVVSICATALEPLTYEICKDVTIQMQRAPVIHSPSTRMVCANDALYLNSTPFYYTTVLWESSGDGTFANPELPNTYYYPGEADKTNGNVGLTVYAFGQGVCQVFPEFSNTAVIVLPSPEIVMPAEAVITETESYLINAVVTGGMAVQWSSSGDGTFEVINLGVAKYFPGIADIQNGEAEISAYVEAAYPCITGASAALLVHIHRIHNIEFPAGWYGFSSFINSDITVEDLFAPIIDDLIIAQTQCGVFWPQGGINTLMDFSCFDGYKLKMTTSRLLTLIGPASKNTTINLSAGWNLIPVLSDNAVDCQSIAAQLGSSLVIIKEVAGTGVIWPEMNISTIDAFEPGRAYMIAVDAACQLVYADCSTYKSVSGKNPAFVNATPWPEPEKTTLSHTVAFPPEASKNLMQGDVIAAFNHHGLCTGMAQYVDENKSFALAIYGDEVITSKIESMMEGDVISYKVFRAEDEIYDLEIAESFLSKHPASQFTENGLSVAEVVTYKDAGAGSSFSIDFDIFPNPCSGEFHIISTFVTGRFLVTVADLNGRVVLSQNVNGKTKLDMCSYPRGMYIITVSGHSVHYVEKLVLK
jgi:hypothetical protein